MNKIYSVSQVSYYIKDMFKKDILLSGISVRGEVGSLKYHSSGHVYFTIKDEYGAINCVMWRSSVPSGLKFKLEEGQKVVVTGSVETYEKNSSYQLYARRVELDGIGRLYAEFERLKSKLEAEGLFNEVNKKPVPKYPRTIGIVTARTGAAIQDIITVCGRRDPYVELILYPAKVQGEGAAISIASGIKKLDEMGLDTIIVGRGGGSMEDLWCFNDERVARAIYACNTPVISAVGHEVDFTIADFVADLRAATPSAAAELAVPDVSEVLSELNSKANLIRSHFMGKLRLYTENLNRAEMRLLKNSPEHKLMVLGQSVDEHYEKLFLSMEKKLDKAGIALDGYEKKLISDMSLSFEKTKRRLEVAAARLNGLSPLAKLASGYSYIEDKNGHNVSSVKGLHEGDSVKISFSDGSANAVIKSIEQT